ncbi:hypothetical protein LOD99_12193 [Oopsacas minuta]|uniref:Uncharacterized protein n=1 Tax=Oopsacas minuta TaxID=111878 RepID=A0AAV7JEX6_9METZ|nr:hypothetical protein LOD99_12193 [Oopsacas minuta]
MACVDPSTSEKCFEIDVQLVYPKFTERIILKANQSSGIAFYSTDNNRIVLWINYSDIVGIKFVKVYETRGFIESNYGAMSIISYPETTSYFRGRYRTRTETIVKTAATIEVSSQTDEKKVIINWTEELLKIYHNYLLKYFQYFDVDSRVEVVDPFKDRKLLVILNPVSGKGTCPKIFKEEESYFS